MKAIRLKTTAALLISMALVVAACEPKPNNNGGKGGKGGLSETEKLVKRHIDELANETDWAKAQDKFDKNKKDINSVIKRSNLKSDLETLNKQNYCLSMDNIMLGILDSNICSSNHKMLREIHAVRVKGDFASISSSIHDDVEQLFKSHEEISGFISKVKRDRKKVGSYHDDYDRDTENKYIGTATNYLKKDLKCDELKVGLQNIVKGSVFKARRKDFCDNVIQLYIEADNYSPNEHKAVSSKIRGFSEFFNKRGEPLNDDANKWATDLENFQKSHEKTTKDYQ